MVILAAHGSSINIDQVRVSPMFLLKKILSAWLLPPLGLMVVALAALVFYGRRKSGLAIAGIAVMLNMAMSLPLIADHLSQPLEGEPISNAALHKTQAIVILGGGVRYGAPEYGGDTLSKYSLERVRYGAKLARDVKLPILVTGGRVFGGQPEGKLMQRILEVEFSIPVRWTETQSRDTAENAAYSATLLQAAGIRHIALVTHAAHMPRAVAAFEKYGFEVTPAPTGFAPQGTPLFESLLPSVGAFERSANAIHEYVGRLLLS
jgi:uncharacterized SAM-binding protein YcdF (DUF218 family)